MAQKATLQSETLQEVTIRDAERILKETVHIYLEKKEDGEYRLPQNKQRPVYLSGPAGVGKTELVSQVAADLQLGFVSYSLTHHTRQSAVGMPAIVEREVEGRSYTATEYTMSEIVDAVYSEIRQGRREGILFVDEVNCVSETLTAVMLQFLQNKCFGTHKIPQGWVIVTAGNPLEYNKSARPFDAVTADRLRRLYIVPNAQVWLEYAEKVGIHPLIMEYVRTHSARFYQYEKKGEQIRIVTARGWEDLSNALRAYERLEYEVDLALVLQFIQDLSTAQDFMNSYQIYRGVLKEDCLEELLAGRGIPETAEMMKKKEYQMRWYVLMMLLNRLQLSAQETMEGWNALKDGNGEIRKEVFACVEQWHSELDHVLEFVELTFSEGKEMEFLLSSLCRNVKTGYLLGLKENKRYREVYGKMQLGADSSQALMKEIKRARG
ncbi:MAG: AAA family ATPase [Lachnospiraceae bacterium]|nr:AAA family ATPase [Lachnospiraceae bacterium]